MGILYNLRRNYKLKELSDSNLPSEPIKLFQKWFDKISKGEYDIEPNAMSLSTATKQGKPSCRMVLLKSFNKHGFVFFTNYQSRKALEISENPFASLLFFWYPLERQVRIEGSIEKIPQKKSDGYFSSRPADSQIGAIISPQSKTIPNRNFLIDSFNQVKSNKKNTLARPNFWGGYLVKPVKYEFWQGRSNRLHDRIEYNLNNGQWVWQRLAP